jgi:diguanylate cyclase (GGDEF)-like protein
VAENADIIAALEGEEELSPRVREALANLVDQNSLLRASLAEMRERVSELEQLADSDTLTPLPNRRRFLRELERVTAYAKRHGTPAAVLYVDLDSLKAINDRHGHFAGDAALIHVARLLQGLIRTTDVAARIGGDEFALILDHLDHDSAIDTAERIARCIAGNPLDLGGSLVALEASIGTATILPGDNVDDVMQRADRNMYLAKAEG